MSSFAQTGIPPEPPMELAGRVGGAFEQWRDIAEGHRRSIEHVLPEDWDYADKALLDFGCGPGRTMSTFWDLRERTEVFGCDIHRASIDWGNRNMSPPFTFFACEEEPPLEQPDERFDLIYACSVFTHITDAWARWLVELHRVLRPGGILVSSVLNWPMAEPIFGRPWDDRTGMAPAYLGRPWDEGGPCVALSEWWVREHWGRAFEILRFEEGVESNGTLVGHGWVAARKLPGSPTAEQLEAIDLDDARERAAMEYNLDNLTREARSEGERASTLKYEIAHLRALKGAPLLDRFQRAAKAFREG